MLRPTHPIPRRRNDGPSRPNRRPSRGRRAFTLLELLVLSTVCAVLLGSYIRALDNADMTRELMRGDDNIRFWRNYGGPATFTRMSKSDQATNAAGTDDRAHPDDRLQIEPSTIASDAPTIAAIAASAEPPMQEQRHSIAPASVEPTTEPTASKTDTLRPH